MCFGGNDNAQKELKRQELAREQAITKGMGQIEKTFSVFDPTYYEGVRKANLGALMPQFTEQHQANQDSLGFTLARRGLLQSSAGRQAGTALASAATRGRIGVANQANQAVQDAQARVQGEKQNLTNMLLTSQNPALAAQQAVSSAASIKAPSAIAPIGDLFQTFANTYLGRQVANTYNPDRAPGAGGRELGKNRIY